MRLGLWAAACVAWQSPTAPPSHRCVPRLAAVESSSSPAVGRVAWSDLTDDAQRLTDGQVARTIASVTAEGVLSTRAGAVATSGAAFSSYAPFVLDDHGNPIIPLLSQEVSSNLEEDRSATLYVRAPRGGAAASSSVSLIGTVESVSIDDIADDKLARLSEETGKSVEQIAACSWLRVVPQSVHLTDTVRGAETWVAPSEYAEAEPNPLAPATASLLAKLNGQHHSSLRRFAAVFHGVPDDELVSAEVLGVDQLGFDLKVQLGASAPTTQTRIGFRLPPANEEEAISVFMKLHQEAYERQYGFM